MGRGASGYVNLLSHSPVDTPCPEYRICSSRDALLSNPKEQGNTTPVASRADIHCPVQIHAQESGQRGIHRQSTETTEVEYPDKKRTSEKYAGKRKDGYHLIQSKKKSSINKANYRNPDIPSKSRKERWINLDQDDGAMNEYILIDDKYLGVGDDLHDDEELSYPEDETYNDNSDIDSHGKYDSLEYDSACRRLIDRTHMDGDLDSLYPLANSHENAYQDSNSHNNYSELYTRILNRQNSEIQGDDETRYSVSANSHSDYTGTLSEGKNDNRKENFGKDLMAPEMNYEIANSHSNYRVFYDNQAQRQGPLSMTKWPPEAWTEDGSSRFQISTLGHAEIGDNRTTNTAFDESAVLFPQPLQTTNQKREPEMDATCDIEQCLMQIEESLINIEQNLLHVQDLDIPELRNLLYKSPSIERSLYEVHDLLYAENMEALAKRGNIVSLGSRNDEEDEEEDEEDETDERWVEENFNTKHDDNEDDDAAAPFNGFNEESSDTANQEESSNKEKTTEDRSSSECADGSTCLQDDPSTSSLNIDPEKAVNFVPNSLGKTPPRRVTLGDSKENIRLFDVDYNLNCMVEKKLLCRDKCHSRTNSLDENSLQCSEFGDRRAGGYECAKTSLQNLYAETRNSIDICGKARSESALLTRHGRLSASRNGRESNEDRLGTANANTEDSRSRVENGQPHKKSASVDWDNRRKHAIRELAGNLRDVTRNGKSPTKGKRSSTSSDKDKEMVGEKTFGCDKRKRKKLLARGQNSSENALVPNKLISLSLSLLLAALLQAVRCLTDLVEDAFRSVNYDRTGLLQ